MLVLFWQPILVYMAKVDGKFLFAPVSVNFLTEAVKIFFTLVGLLWHVSVWLLNLLCLPSSALWVEDFGFETVPFLNPTLEISVMVDEVAWALLKNPYKCDCMGSFSTVSETTQCIALTWNSCDRCDLKKKEKNPCSLRLLWSRS